MWSIAARCTLLASLLLPANEVHREIYHVPIVERNHVYDDTNKIRLRQFIYVDWIDGKRVARGWTLTKDATLDVTHNTLYVSGTRNYEVRYTLYVVTSSNFDNEIIDRTKDHRLTIPAGVAMTPCD